MRVGILGTGVVGRTIATKLVELGHEVMVGSRTADNRSAVEWAADRGERARIGTFASAADFGEMLFNCTKGDASISALDAAGAEHLGAKILVDVANPLDFSRGMPPTIFVASDDSLAEQIQRRFPALRVVKALNTVNSEIMVDPARIPGDHDIFVSGNDPDAKLRVVGILESFGWRNVIDLGDLSTARGTEFYLALWIRLWGALGTTDFNVRVVRR